MSSPSAGTALAPKRRLIAIGNFDGVHLGHQHLLGSLIERAEQRDLLPTVLTFDPHPAVVLGREQPMMLTSLSRKLELLQSLHPQLEVLVQRFDLELANYSPEAFAEQLAKQHAAAEVIVGANFRFGKDRAGNLGMLQRFGQQFGFAASATSLFSIDSEVVSSSRIRQAVRQGNLELANRLLGRPHSLSGVVVAGDGRGRQIGFSTANLSEVPELLPKFGVYAVRVEGPELMAPAKGVMNVGVRPTLDAGELRIEVHLLDFEGDLYGKRLRVELVKSLREERKFDSFEALRVQIEKDAAAAAEVLG